MELIGTIIAIIIAIIGSIVGSVSNLDVADSHTPLVPETSMYTPAYAETSVERPEPMEGAYNIVYSNGGATVSYNVVQNGNVCSVYTDYSHANGAKSSSMNCLD